MSNQQSTRSPASKNQTLLSGLFEVNKRGVVVVANFVGLEGKGSFVGKNLFADILAQPLPDFDYRAFLDGVGHAEIFNLKGQLTFLRVSSSKALVLLKVTHQIEQPETHLILKEYEEANPTFSITTDGKLRIIL
jgi:hypothetical protein